MTGVLTQVFNTAFIQGIFIIIVLGLIYLIIKKVKK